MRRGTQRPLGAIVLAAVATWFVHAAVDWDWELPAATLWLFAFGGCVLAAWRPGARARAPSPPWRVVATVLCLALAATPVTIAVSQERLDRAVAAFLRDDCEEAEREAASATDVLSVRAEPYEVLAYCASRRGEDDRAVRMMTEALDHDPSSWEYEYGLALVRAAGGEDPKAPALEALRLNPLETMVREAVRALAGVDLVEDALRDFGEDDPARWQRVARRSPVPLP